MDGTIYLDYQLFPKTIDFLEFVKQQGAKVMYITNNSSKSVLSYIEKLSTMGITTSPEDFYTSSMATSRYIKDHYKDPHVFLVGTKSLEQELLEEGIHVTTSIEDQINLILLGYDRELTYQKLDDLSYLLTTRNLPYLATNPDKTCPTSYGFVPDCGSIADMIGNATKKYPFFIGKPNPMMIEYAIEKAACSKDETVVIGDRLHTDILSGIHAGVDTILVLSGESTLFDNEVSSYHPTMIYQNIENIYEELKKGDLK